MLTAEQRRKELVAPRGVVQELVERMTVGAMTRPDVDPRRCPAAPAGPRRLGRGGMLVAAGFSLADDIDKFARERLGRGVGWIAHQLALDQKPVDLAAGLRAQRPAQQHRWDVAVREGSQGVGAGFEQRRCVARRRI